jgi:uncharacterized protein
MEIIMRYLALLLFLFTTIGSADTFFEGKGKVDSYPIAMQLSIDELGKVTGHYLYLSHNIPIKLKGEVSDNKLVLHTVDNPQINESFEGRVVSLDGKMAGAVGHWTGEYSLKFSVYQSSFYDQNMTCDEMEAAPELILSNSDSEVNTSQVARSINWYCPKNIAKFSFFTDLIKLANTMRGDIYNGCQGSIAFEHRRWFYLSLLHLGYNPQYYLELPYIETTDTGVQHELNYLKQWSYSSLYNRQIYNTYLHEMERVKPLLEHWYADNHGFDSVTAAKLTEYVIAEVVAWGFGHIAYDMKLKAVVPYTEMALTGEAEEFSKALSNASNQEMMNTLKRFILQNAAQPLVQQVVDSLSSVKVRWSEETPLSLAVNNPALLNILLARGFAVEHQNGFGKTPLFYAVELSQYDSVKTLLEHGADVNHEYKQNEPHQSCGIKQWKRTPLMHAAQHSDTKMLQLLLENGADMHAQDVFNSSAIDYAAKNNMKENADFLLKKQEETTTNLHAQGSKKDNS